MDISKRFLFIVANISLILVLFQNLSIQASDLNKSNLSTSKKAQVFGTVNLSDEMQTYILEHLFLELINKSKSKNELLDDIKKNIPAIASVNSQFDRITNDLKFINSILKLIAQKYGMSLIEVAMELDIKWSRNFINNYIQNNSNSNNKELADLLFWAAKKGHVKTVKLLVLNFNINVNIKDRNSMTPLMHAAKEGRKKAVKFFISCRGIDVNLKGYMNMSALIWAAKEGHQRVVQLFLSCSDIDVNIKDIPLGMTALMHAVLENNKEVVKLLLSHFGTDIYIKNTNNQTALKISKKEKYHEIVKLIKKHIKDNKKKNKKNK